MTAPIELILASFDGEQAADAALKELKELQKDGVIIIANAAVLVKHADGRASFKETEDVRAPAGALFGAIVGAVVGLLGGPAGVIVGAAAGAATGGVAAHQIDMGFSDKDLRDIEALLPNGSSAIIALVSLEWVDQVVRALEELDARLWRQALKDDVLTPAEAAHVIEGKASVVSADAPQTGTAAAAAPPSDAPASAEAQTAPSAPTAAAAPTAAPTTSPTAPATDTAPAAPAAPVATPPAADSAPAPSTPEAH
jgi:uncharacterized membrane protein